METHKCLLFSSFFIEMLGKITSTTTNNVFGRDSVFTILMFHFLTPPPPPPEKKKFMIAEVLQVSLWESAYSKLGTPH